MTFLKNQLLALMKFQNVLISNITLRGVWGLISERDLKSYYPSSYCYYNNGQWAPFVAPFIIQHYIPSRKMLCAWPQECSNLAINYLNFWGVTVTRYTTSRSIFQEFTETKYYSTAMQGRVTLVCLRYQFFRSQILVLQVSNTSFTGLRYQIYRSQIPVLQVSDTSFTGLRYQFYRSQIPDLQVG